MALVKVPTDSINDLSQNHHKNSQLAQEAFRKASYMDTDQKYLNKLKVTSLHSQEPTYSERKLLEILAS